MKSLSQAQVEAFRHDGYLYPFPMLRPAEVADALAALERYERWLGMPLTAADRSWSTMPYWHLPWFNALLRDPRILDVVEDLIGPDILAWTSTFWIKEPGSPGFAAWHQDSAYFGHDPIDVLTVWLALTDATREAGCINVLPWNGQPRLLHHVSRKHAASINRGGQTVVEPFDDSRAQAMPLPAGSFSVHHGLCMHQSAPNRAGYRRIGLGFNYIPARVRTTGSVRMPAMLVRGSDRWGHFDLLDPATEELSAQGIALHERAYAAYGRNYREQQERHEQAFAKAP
jgi:ectoine hydroxylase-related dioxygenase (phytanoyl-CoA dioxygenase family)